MSDTIDDLIAETLKIPRERVTDALESGAILEWDSLAHVNLMLRIEADYGVEIDEDTMIELTSVRGIRDFLRDQA